MASIVQPIGFAPMGLQPGTYKIGPSNSTLHLRTSREGLAAKVGHDLLIGFDEWSGSITVDGDDAASAAVEVEIEMASLRVLEGTGGVAALTPDDSRDIVGTATKLLDVANHPTAIFRSTRVSPVGTGATIDGDLTLRGATETVTLEVTQTRDSSWQASATVIQSVFGIKPYRAFFGALKLADAVAVEVVVDLAAS
jgi:polyisoprenoid-binding protein YceI